MRFCGIKCCKNSQGTLDQSIIFFRFQLFILNFENAKNILKTSCILQNSAKGTELRDKWLMILSSSSNVELSFEYFDYLCQSHFKPEDFHMEMHNVNETPAYKLKSDAVPLPIEK